MSKIPTYAEQPHLVSVNEHQAFQPWRVAMPVQRTQFDTQASEDIYFVRAPKPGLAAVFAEKLWQKYEKRDKGLTDPFPDVLGYVGAEPLDEEEYKEFWAEAQRYPHRFEGVAANPLAFTFWKPKKETLIFDPTTSN